MLSVSVNREELKRMIDTITDQDAAEVLDFIGYLKMNHEREALFQMDIDTISTDEELILQVQKSREDRELGQIYEQGAGLDYLRNKIEEFEREQDI